MKIDKIRIKKFLLEIKKDAVEIRTRARMTTMLKSQKMDLNLMVKYPYNRSESSRAEERGQ